MLNELILRINDAMKYCLDDKQALELNSTLKVILSDYKIEHKKISTNLERKLIDIFLAAKAVEGCSAKTIKYYSYILQHFIINTNKGLIDITAYDLRNILESYQNKSKVSKVTVDNVRRIFSSFFKWLENEDYIIKSPVRKINKIKYPKIVKEVLSDDDLEKIRDNCANIRDLAMVDLLISSGIRVGELVKLNITHIDFINRECIVFGKGEKERKVYFDAKTKMHLEQYLSTRVDSNDALFVSLLKPYKRLEISGVEIIIRNLGRKLNINKLHPHKFRRTLATKAIDKGMPIEQVQHLLGHSNIDTTLQYAMVEQNNVKNAHKKFLT